MRNRKRFQCKTDLKLWRQMSKLSKEEVAESIFCSTRTIERIEKENATPNEETAKRLSDLYKIKFGDQFYVINKDEEEWLKKELSCSYRCSDGKVIDDNIYYLLYVRKVGMFRDCVFSKGKWVRDFNRNKEVRRLHEIKIKEFLLYHPKIPILNKKEEWYYWYFNLIVGKVYKVIVSRECMSQCLSGCLKEVVISKDGMFCWEGVSDMMYWGTRGKY